MKIENLRVDYGNFTALNIEDAIEFMPGDRIGIIGGNGAGKTTFAKAVCGLVPYQGKIISDLKHGDIAIHQQENAYVKRMPVHIIMEAILNTTIKENDRLMELIKFFDFEESLKKRYAQLSGGQKQKMTIILVIMQNKQLTFFDEVTSGLDFESRSKLMDKIREWYSTKENTVCVVSHYYDELENFVNKLLILDKGKVMAFGDVDELFKKYCSKVVFVISNTERNQKLTKDLKKLVAPAHLIAFAAPTKKDEESLSELFVKENINFKRSNKDLEILFINAIAGGK